MWVFVGLGNIGREYNGTRHNIGFDVVDHLEPKLARSTGWKAGKGDYYVAKGFWRNAEVLLVKPTTYMNLSGRAVRDVLQFYKAEIGNMVVITDDIAIPLGTLRLRLRGSNGGHNGLGSIIYETGTDDFARLRMGVGADYRKGEQARFVLSPFKESEQSEKQKMIDEAVVGLLAIVEQGLERAMNTINASGKPEKKESSRSKQESSARQKEDGGARQKENGAANKTNASVSAGQIRNSQE